MTQPDVLTAASEINFMQLLRPAILTALVLISARPLSAGDWPTHRADAARSGYTAESLPETLSLTWQYQMPHPPQPAWPRSDRLTFDRAEEPIVAGGRVFIGSSVDGQLRALDAATGREFWSRFTGGPIRLAPVAWQDHVLVASDDGHLYCFAASDGELLWRHRGGPDHSRRLGNERMISKWPARGGPVVLDGVVYYAAGIWPSDGIFIHALDAASGEVRWSNNESGSIYMPQPHGGADANSGVSAQGYLVTLGEQLFVPTGRAVPAAFDRTTGRFQYFHLQQNRAAGGSFVMAAERFFYNSGVVFDAPSGKAAGQVGAGPIAALPDGIIRAAGGKLGIYRWAAVKTDGENVSARALARDTTIDGVATDAALIVAGNHAISGGDGQVDRVDLDQQKVVWSGKVDGNAYGLAVADGRLYVSTDRGQLYCFDDEPSEPRVIAQTPDDQPYEDNTVFAAAADQIIDQAGVQEGYCLDLGCGDGRLAYELAKRTDLHIIAVESDAEQVEQARRKLARAGLYGSRVTVLHAPLESSGLASYFADLVVSARSVAGNAPLPPDAEFRRMQRPYGGTLCLGAAGTLTVDIRGELEGAGNWTHQYADPGNTVSSEDRLVSGELGVLWFRDVDLELPQRHGRGPAPLFDEGRIFYEGLNEIRCVDAYNGRDLWSYELPGVLEAFDGDHLMGTSGTGSNYCVADGSLYVRRENHCLRIDAATGALQNKFTMPETDDGRDGPWGYIACTGGILYGTRANPEHVVTYRYQPGGDLSQQLTESDWLFALDAKSGQPLWEYRATDSIRHNAVAIGGKHVYLIDRPMAQFDRTRDPRGSQDRHPTGALVALDRITGEVAWRNDEDIYGTTLAVSDELGVLIMAYQDTRFKLASEVGGRITAFRAEEGYKIWDVEAQYKSRLTLTGRTIYADGGAWDVMTGQARPFHLQRSYGCGVLSASANLLFFRSATLGYFDLETNTDLANFGGMRPGCWINAIPAGGLVLVPDASAGCSCSYLNRAWIALAPAEQP
ncbi:MAG: PQQ-binding-like beta-propeller repeat protein [Pirellulales bacterium]